MNVSLARLPKIENHIEKGLNMSCPEGLERQIQPPENSSALPKTFLRPFKAALKLCLILIRLTAV